MCYADNDTGNDDVASLTERVAPKGVSAPTCPYTCDIEVERSGREHGEQYAGCETYFTCYKGDSGETCGPSLGDCEDDPGDFVSFFRNQNTECAEALCDNEAERFPSCCDEYEDIK